MTTTQTAFKTVMAQAETLRAKSEKAGAWAPEDVKAYQGFLDQADALKLQMELDKRADELKSWGGQSAGSVTGAILSRPATPFETQDAAAKDADGEPVDDRSARLNDLMASKSYHYAMEDYLRSSLTGRAMKGGSAKVLQTGIDTSGGAWTTPEFNPLVVAKLPAPFGFANDVTTWNTGSNMMTFPKMVYNGASDDTTGSLYSNPMRWAISAEAPYSDYSEATNPIAGRANIQVYTYTLPVIITRAMIDDGQFSVIDWVSKFIAENLQRLKNYLYIQGSGAGQPRGVLNHPNASVASTSGGMYVPSGVSAAVTWAGVTSGSTSTPDSTKGYLGTQGALPPQYDPNAKWYMTKKTGAATRSLLDAQMRPLWLPTDSYPNFRTGTPAQLLGAPVVYDQFVSEISANAYSVIHGDAKGYYALERTSMDLRTLTELRALKDEWVIFARWRGGGDLVEDWRLKLMKCAAS